MHSTPIQNQLSVAFHAIIAIYSLSIVSSLDCDYFIEHQFLHLGDLFEKSDFDIGSDSRYICFGRG